MKTAPWYLMVAFSAVAYGQDKAALPLPASGNVTLPIDDYNRLADLASKPVKKPDAAPVPFTIQSADLKFQAVGEAATGTIQFEGEIFRTGATLVPLASGLTVLDARQKNSELPLQQAGGTDSAVLSGPGVFSVTLNGGVPITVEPGLASLKLPVPMAGAARLTLTIPGDRTIVNLDPGLITARRSSNGETTVEATLVPGATASIWWGVRQTAPQPAAPREVRFLSDVKTLVSVSEADLSLTVLADVTVVQGDPSRFEIALPAGYEVTGVTGSTLATSDAEAGLLTLQVQNAAQRSHQFLISLTKASAEAKTEVPILTLKNTQRETGEILVEGEGTMELTATESGSLKRMDVKEGSSYLRDLARSSLHAAFRYHRQAGEAPGLSLAWVRFPDSSVLGAVAQDAEVTTMVTSDGKSLTEVKLTVRNQSQPFLKVALPAGATIVSAEVAGGRVKPAQGTDGSRVPLLRTGFRPSGPYTVSYVYMDSGAPFAKKGGSELDLPKMDVPIGVVHWEVFLPERYKVTNFGGDVVAAELMPVDAGLRETAEEIAPHRLDVGPLFTGQLGGVVTDSSGAVVPHAHVTVTDIASGAARKTETDLFGRWVVSNVTSGKVRIRVESLGFKTAEVNVDYASYHPGWIPTVLQVGNVSMSVEVTTAETVMRTAPPPPPKQEPTSAPASANVVNLQKRVAGVLPIAIDVPHAGTSFRFVRPLVVDEETKVTFSYKTK
jgi:hypothetical protein